MIRCLLPALCLAALSSVAEPRELEEVEGRLRRGRATGALAECPVEEIGLDGLDLDLDLEFELEAIEAMEVLDDSLEPWTPERQAGRPAAVAPSRAPVSAPVPRATIESGALTVTKPPGR